jgi:hypothetical protein
MTQFYAIFADKKIMEMIRSWEGSHQGANVLGLGNLRPASKGECATDVHNIFMLKKSKDSLSEEKKKIMALERYEWCLGHPFALFLFAMEYLKSGGDMLLVKGWMGNNADIFRSLEEMEIIDLDVDAAIRILEPFGGYIHKLSNFEFYKIYRFVTTNSQLPAPSAATELDPKTTDRIQSLWEVTVLRRRE